MSELDRRAERVVWDVGEDTGLTLRVGTKLKHGDDAVRLAIRLGWLRRGFIVDRYGIRRLLIITPRGLSLCRTLEIERNRTE